MNLYLDIDGTIITKDGKEAKHLLEFLRFVTDRFDCYWLSTHCKGDASTALWYIKDKVSQESFGLLEKFKPTDWQTLKTEAIDFLKDFIWIDDYVMKSEKEVLKKNNTLKNLIEVNLNNDPDQLLKVISQL